MRSSDLSQEQFRQISQQLRARIAYLRKLQNRIDQTAFPVDDPLRIRLEKAINALHELSVWVHYQSCEEKPDNKKGT